MSNFNFLTDINPELAQFGKSAELYCHDDKQVALVKLRCFTELVVGEIYSRLSLTPPVRDDLYLSLIQILRCLVRTMLKMPRTAPPPFQGGGWEGVLLACWLKPSY